MSLPRLIARRTASDRGTSQNAMVHIATIAVAISIAVVMISLSVLMGFRESITSLISDTVADITVADIRASKQPELHPITDKEALRSLITNGDNIATVERYALRGGVLRSKKGAAGIAIKGVGEEANLSYYSSRLSEGDMLRFEEARRKELLLSESVAEKLSIESGDRVEVLLLEGDTPRRELFKVGGIYRSALGDIGAEIALTDIRNVQKLNGWESSQISGYSCRLENSGASLLFADLLNLKLMYDYEGEENVVATASQESHADIFGWLETHDVNAMVILAIMLIVAIFNMVTALLILVLERTRMIGTLKSMGMTNSEIRKIFTYRASIIMVRGLIFGNIAALALLLAQRYLHLVHLDESGYLLSEVPVAFDAWWMVGANLLFVAVIVVVIHLATAIVQRVKVADAIKFE